MSQATPISSRIAGFYRKTLAQRRAFVGECGLLAPDSARWLEAGGGLDCAIADRMSENVIGSQGMPLGVGLNFRINQRDYLVPMVVEEPSVVAAASNAARLVRISGGFTGAADEPVMTAQVQLDQVPDPASAPDRIQAAKAALLAAGNRAIPRMVERGGGCVDIETRVLDQQDGMVVVHVYVNVGDAMGANLVDSVAEAVAPRCAEVLGGRMGLRILSNLPLRRLVRVSGRVSAEAIGGDGLAAAIARASRFAELDPMRAVTHNKGIMNGVDAVALAVGQDWRAIEAAAHAYAALRGGYQPLSTWRMGADGALHGSLEMPLAVATVGGATRVHPGVRACFELLDISPEGGARELAVIVAAVGLASNLAALKALAGEGIQRGHMRLHQRRLEPTSAAQVEQRGGIGDE